MFYEQASLAIIDIWAKASAFLSGYTLELISLVVADARLSISAAVLAGLITWASLSYLRSRHEPPGPPRLPFLGNVLQVPKQMPWYQFTEWTKKYGPIFSLDLLGQRVVVLNTHEMAADLFDRRSNIYSDRPRIIMAGEILAGNAFIGFLRYGNLWRRMRRASHEGLNVRAIKIYESIQAKAAAQAVSNILAQPGSWEDHIKRFAASTILSSVYGWPTKDLEPSVYEHLSTIAARIAHAALPGSFLVDLIPIYELHSREGLAWHKQETQMFEEYSAGVAAKMDAGSSQRSFVTELIEMKDRHGLSKREAAWLAGTQVIAGTETTSSTLVVFMLAMTLYPEVMRKAQAEIDAVVGHKRAPTFEDMIELPYIRAMVKETLRWRPVVPMGLPHRTSEDDWYKGYFIPKGTSVIGNIWYGFYPAMYPDFDAFPPDRFLDATGKVEVTPPDTHQMGHVSYGFGRRHCVGMHFANQTLLIAIATMVWAFNIEPPVDEEGMVILPSATESVDLGIVVAPVPFKCRISARFPEAQAILNNIYKEQSE
ncbi:cytochrome P450 [Cytidiella melzeri]|nr:cytochrome P450 [Cytidiella melzeri]